MSTKGAPEDFSLRNFEDEILTTHFDLTLFFGLSVFCPFRLQSDFESFELTLFFIFPSISKTFKKQFVN